MRRKLIYISVLFAAMLMILSCSAYASNVLLISEEETVSGTDVATIMGKIAPNDYNITEVSIAKGSSLEQTINSVDLSGKEFDSVIIQLPYADAIASDSKANMVSAINTLYTKVKKAIGTKVFIGTPVGKVSNYDAEIALSQGVVNSIKTGLTTIEVSSIPVYENIGTATSKSLVVCADNKLTSLGNLLVACTYCNGLGKPITTLSSYDKLNDADVKGVVEISSSGATTNDSTSEQGPIAEEKIEDENDQAEIDGEDVVIVNREPIMDIGSSDPKELIIRVYDKENAGLKTVSLMVNDANGTKIEQEKTEDKSTEEVLEESKEETKAETKEETKEETKAETKEETKEENKTETKEEAKEESKEQSYTFKIDREKYLDAKEYKQFYIYAEDNDGCILKEYFKVKYIESAENGSYYKINRAPRIRPKAYSETKEKKVNMISLYVMDQTGVQKVTPMTVEENDLKAVNLFADGKYNGYDGIEGNYEWQDVKGKTTTSSKVYIKEAHTKDQDVTEFFKYENTEEKVSLLLGDNKYRFNTHAVDATGLAADRVMIVDFSGKDEDTSDNTTSDDTTNASTPSASNSSVAQKTSSTSKAEEKGTLKDTNGSYSGYEFRAFKADREPRLKYFPKSDYLYIEIRDCSGVACEYPSGEGNEKREANKSLQPQIYYYKNDKRGSVVPNLKRPTEGEYKKEKETYEFVYTIGLPVKEIGTEYTKFEIVARDVPSHTKLKTQTYIDEVFMAKKSSDGKIIVDRAPVVHIVGLMSNYKLMSAHVMDWTGVSKVELKSLPKSSGQQGDIIRSWNGAVQNNWSLIASCTKNKKYVTNALSKFEKIDTVFSRSNWKGLNPKISGEDGVYQVEISAADASGAKSTKIMIVDIKRWVKNHDEWGETGNATKKSSSKAKTTAKSGSASKKSSSASSSSKKAQSKNSSEKNTKEKKSGSSSEGSSNKTSGSERNLKEGMSGEDVKKLQERLNELGWNISVTDRFSHPLDGIVRMFQRLNDLKVDGVVGPKTREKLYSDDVIGYINEELRENDKGKSVKYLQRLLNKVTNSKLEIDGVFGPKTKKAVKKFQEDNGLTSNGELDANTRNLLYSKKQEGTSNEHEQSTDVGKGSDDSKGSSKKNAIEDRSKFKVGVSQLYEKDLYMDSNAAENTIFTIYGNGGKIDSFEVESGKVKSSSINNSTIRLCVVPDGTEKYKTEEISDIYATITVYCKNDGKWYKDSCRLHCIYAKDKSWWNNPKNTKNIKVNLD